MMNASQARVVDPILTTHAQGYQNSEFVGHALFPEVFVDLAGGKVIEFGKEAFMQYSTAIAPGSGTKRVTFGYAGKDYALEEHSLEGLVPNKLSREAARGPGIDLGRAAVSNTMSILKLSLEIQQAGIATNASNYDSDHKVALTSTAKWSHADGNPNTDVDTGREAIRASCGRYPNTALLSALAFKAARNNAKVKEQFKYTSADSITPEMLAKAWSLDRVVVGAAVKATDAGVMSDVWGNNAVLAYVAKPTGGSGGQITLDMAQPSYGFTYTMRGHPFVEEPYPERNAKSWIYPVNYERKPVLSGIIAGYLIQTPN